MTKPLHNTPKEITITEHGAKSDRKATAYVKAMLEAFHLEGDFTLTTNFGYNEGHTQKHGIRIRSHAHTGVELEIQPEKGSSRFYQSWLAWKGHEPSELRNRLHEKFAGQKRFIIGEWKDPDKVVTFTPDPALRAKSNPEPSPLPDIPEEETGEEESLRGYVTNEDDRNTVLLGVYDSFRHKWFSAHQFVTTMKQKCNIRGSTAGLKNLLRRLTKKGFFGCKSDGPLETFRISETVIAFLSDSGLISQTPEEMATASSPEMGDIAARILGLSYQAEQFRSANHELARNEDDQKLIADEIGSLERMLETKKKHLENLKLRQKELVQIIENPELANASKDLAEIVQGKQL